MVIGPTHVESISSMGLEGRPDMGGGMVTLASESLLGKMGKTTRERD